MVASKLHSMTVLPKLLKTTQIPPQTLKKINHWLIYAAAAAQMMRIELMKPVLSTYWSFIQKIDKTFTWTDYLYECEKCNRFHSEMYWFFCPFFLYSQFFSYTFVQCTIECSPWCCHYCPVQHRSILIIWKNFSNKIKNRIQRNFILNPNAVAGIALIFSRTFRN